MSTLPSDQYMDYVHRVAGQDVQINHNGGIYQNGKSYNYMKKIEVAVAYKVVQDGIGGGRPNLSAIARQCSVGWEFVKKIETELNEHGRVLHPSEVYSNREQEGGPGSRSLDDIDSAVLMFLYLEEPSRQLSSFCQWLHFLTGTCVSESTVSRFFNHGFPIRGGLCRPNLVPIDKFKPENIERAFEYLQVLAQIAPHRLVFGDKKHLKGQDIFNRKNRKNPMTGEIPLMMVNPDFRNTYNLTGFCKIDPTIHEQAVWCSIHEDLNDADNFALELEYGIQQGFIRGGQVLVIDNAAVHTGRENTVLQEYLWDEYGIFLLFLPPRAPEWNPMEHVWKHLVYELKKVPLKLCQEISRVTPHTAAHVAINILRNVSHEQVRRFYVGCKVINE
jgi:transposase